MYNKLTNNKPIRLIELFGGYGSQHFALEYLGANFEHYKLVEWAIQSIQAYKDAHYSNVNIDYSKDLSKDELVDYLFKKGISRDYNEPMTLEQIKRLKENDVRTIYNNIQITKNIVDITQTKASDLEIVDTNNYTYIMTYSFPCQDLSLAGLGKGMARDSGTRSGMLWQVERILDECTELPQILLMENVPEVKGTNNVKFFNEWQNKLESLGYKNYHQNLIATDYGIPQTRNITFMISILGDYNFTFPNTIPLKLKLKDMLESNVDEKYYLSSKQLDQISNWNSYQNPFDTIDKEQCPTLTTRSGAFAAGMVLTKDTENYIEWEQKGRLDIDCRAWKDEKVVSTLHTNSGNIKVLENSNNLKVGGVKIPEATKQGYAIAHDGDGVYINRPHQKRGVVQKDKMQTLKTSPDTGVVVIGNYSPSNHNASRVVDSEYSAPTVMENHGTITATNTTDLIIRKLTPKECFRLMGVKDEDYERIAKNQSEVSLYHLAGDSIVVNVLMAIFGELLDIDWKCKVEKI
jgi:DNA (cytosine-5)-methyltransferase 1